MDIVSYFNCIPEEFLEENSDIYRYESFEEYFKTYDDDDWEILRKELTVNPDCSLKEIVDNLWINYNGDVKLGDYYYHSSDFENYLDCLTMLSEEKGLSKEERDKINDSFARYVTNEWKRQSEGFVRSENHISKRQLSHLEKTFVLDEDVLINNDRESLNFYLWATDGMMKKLINKVGFKGISYGDNYNFYVDLNAKDNTMKLTSTFYRTDEKGEETQIGVELDLTNVEQNFLLKELEDYCFTVTGLSCLDNINESRRDNGLKEIKNNVSLNDKLKQAQARSAEVTGPSSNKNDFDKETE